MSREAPGSLNSDYSVESPRTERVEDIRRWAEGRGLKVETQGRDIHIIVVGEIHAPGSEVAQIELTRLVKPSVILHEGLPFGYYDPVSDAVIVPGSPPVPRRDPAGLLPDSLRPILDVAHELNIPIVTCDLPLPELVALAEKHLPLTITSREAFVARVRLFMVSPEGVALRDEKMAKRILEEASQAPGPVLVIIGTTHAQNLHELRMLQNQKVGYAIVIQEEENHG